MNAKRTFLSLVTSVTAIAIAPSAEAQEDAPLPPVTEPAPRPPVDPPKQAVDADAQELARLDDLLKTFASESRGYRIAGGVSALLIGAAAIPAGIVVLDRDSENAGVGLFVTAGGIGAVLGGALLLAAPFGPVAQMQKLSDQIDAGRSTGRPPRAIIESVESEWRENAETSRSLRRTFGIIGVAVGGVAVATGTTLLLADPIGNLSRPEQDGFGGALLGLGYFSVLLGFQAFFFEEPGEAAWKAYEAGKGPRPKSQPLSLGQPRIGFSPARGGGGAVVLGASF